jgi:hypothetical protein
VGGRSVVLFSARDDEGLCQIDGEIFVRMIWVGLVRMDLSLDWALGEDI